MIELSKEYWSDRYKQNETGWDTGSITTPLKEYIDQLNDKDLKILIPGAGNSYEAEYLFRKGFKNVFVVDITEEPLRNLKTRLPEFPDDHLLLKDFFLLEGKFDLIIEQTFFCALHPSLRNKYAVKMSELLNKEGKLVGLLFNDKLNTDKPPFGGSSEEYLTYFEDRFTIKHFETCYNSIKPRAGRELFILLQKKYA
jgi:thiopurine S-methyltransferase